MVSWLPGNAASTLADNGSRGLNACFTHTPFAVCIFSAPMLTDQGMSDQGIR